MTIEKKLRQNRVYIDLTGPEGNAFVLLGKANQYCNMIGLDAKKVREEMTSGDYENLVKVFDSYFGDFVVLYR